MRLDRISVSNYKGLATAEFEPTNFSCLVGENNAGKSSVLQAIVYSLNRPGKLPLSLYYDTTRPVEFTLRFTGATEDHLCRVAEEHRQRIAADVIDEVLTIRIRYAPDEKYEFFTLRRTPREVRYQPAAIDAAFTGRRGPAAIRAVVEESYPEFREGLPEGLTIGGAKAHLAAQIARLPNDQFELTEGPLRSGIAASISALLPEPIYIPAVKNVADDLKTTQSTSFGRLIGLLLDEMSPDLERVGESLVALNALLNRTTQNGEQVDQRHEKVKDLEAIVERYLSENFPKVKLELNIPPPELKTILNSAQIFVDDGSRDIVDNKGDGLKRSLTFALLQAYVHQLGRAPHGRGPEDPAPQPLLFLFEEPELYLHPRSQRALFSTLARISGTHQVIVTTHSPLFFAPGVTATFVRVAKRDAAPKPVGVLYPVNFVLDRPRAELFQLTRFENADAAFFSKRVVLFEGESDDSYLRHVAKLLNAEWDFDGKNIAMVRVSGKGNFAKFRDFFGAFGIEVKLVADLDVLFDGFHHLRASANANALRQRALETLDRRIADLGIVAEPTARQIRAKVSQDSWRDRYQATRDACRAIQAGDPVDAAMLKRLDRLWVWEQDVARCRACRQDAECAAAILPLIDALRGEGICVLTRGAIEDYYPDEVPMNGPKPDRALRAAALVETSAHALGLSHGLADGRSSELEEVLSELFRDM